MRVVSVWNAAPSNSASYRLPKNQVAFTNFWRSKTFTCSSTKFTILLQQHKQSKSDEASRLPWSGQLHSPSFPARTWICSYPCQRAKPLALAGRDACGVAALPNRSLAPAKCLSGRDIVVKGTGLVVLQDKIVCQGFVGGSLADVGRKTSRKDSKMRRKIMPQGKQRWYRRPRAPHQWRAQ